MFKPDFGKFWINRNAEVSIEALRKIGVLYWQLDTETVENNATLKKIREDRGYTWDDLSTCSPEKVPNFEETLKMFFKEHIHNEEEIRFCTDGSGYFDVRDADDKWIRIAVAKGDMIVIPAGMYHRFSLDTKNFIQARRYFVGEP